MKHAIFSLYVVDTKTGKVIFDKNSQLGLAPASCLKVVTSASAFEMLGKDFRYKTYIGTDPQGDNNFDAGSLFIIGRGDPTLGSWRWKNTIDTIIFSKIAAILQKNKLIRFERNLYVDDLYYGLLPMPEGWIWQDIGNYYGAPCFGFNWHENQYDLYLQPGEKEGWPTTVVSTSPKMADINLRNSITTGAKGSGDNSIIYSSPFSNLILTKGTIQLQKGSFKISGSMVNPSKIFKDDFVEYLRKTGVSIRPESYAYTEHVLSNKSVYKATAFIDSLMSPPLDSINYWFLQKSINLYGEAFLKAISRKHYPFMNTDYMYDSSIAIIKNFWSKNGIEKSALNIIDGSGLSPANRVTTNALVTVMQYAKKQSWYPSFYNALPEQNGIKMKSGYIGGVRSYTGYVISKSGTEYTFSFIINNYNGNPGAVREKMWKLLDILK
ncbi:MAG: D-alanyl-D-alanine carboxypeptidase/D-alanyl-D-alanine-endopeptidase [Chitinophagaceae bacterium]|nr:D-alanyl-D-alanine carboxypeptidase/D-alanyl-D-alanine-endopeptidase [Chitinophagaceae bacterium]